MKRVFTLIAFVLMFVFTGAAAAQDETKTPTPVVQEGQAVDVAETVTPVVENEDEDLTNVIVFIVGAVVGAVSGFLFAVYQRARSGVESAALTVEGALEDTPFSFLDLEDIAETFARNALAQAHLDTKEKQVDFAVAQLEDMVDYIDARTPGKIGGLKRFLRPIVVAAISRIAQDWALIENGTQNAPDPRTAELVIGRANETKG